MRGHFLHLRFKTFPMTPRTPRCEVFWALLLSSEHSGAPEDSKSSLFQVLGFTPALGQSRVATLDLRSEWGLKQTCSSPWELFNGGLHSACTHRGQVDSPLLVVGSQIGNLTPGPSFAHNLCCRCPNGPCQAIFDIYASRPFQRYKGHFKARCFDPCNRVLSFRESQRTPKSPFRECECHPHTPSKWGCDNWCDTFW